MPISEGGRDYTDESGSRNRGAARSRRLVFFGIAATWGFLVGVAGLLAAMGLAGQPIQPPATAIASLIPAQVLAVAGGLVIAGAYQERKRNNRR